MQRFSYPGAMDSVNQRLGSSVSVENPGKDTPSAATVAGKTCHFAAGIESG
jgi:hypothetical protein